MGSSFSIYNDTDTNIYVWNGVQWDYVALGLGLSFGVGTVAAAAYPATAAASPSIAAVGGVTVGGIQTGMSNEAQKQLAAINTFKKESDRKLAPGQIYTYNGSVVVQTDY